MINVTCAIIRNDDDNVLVVQRGADAEHALKWEFPGGKVRDGETDEDCIIREIQEELSLDIIIVATLTPIEHDYGNKKIRLIPFICDTLMDLPVLHEHRDYKWLNISQLAGVDFSEADIPVASEYLNKKSSEIKQDKDVDTSEHIDSEGIKEMLAAKSGYGAVDLVAGLASGNKAVRAMLMQFSLGSDTTLAFRASYTLTKVEDGYPGILEPYYGQMISSLASLSNESVSRSFLKIINLVGLERLSESDHGRLAENCFNLLNKSNSAIAIKAYCMEALYNLTLLYPELAIELSASITRNMEEGSAGIKARGRQILKKLSTSS